MNQWTKTGIFLGVALLVVLIAVFTRPSFRGTEDDGGPQVGKPLFPEFTDPVKVKSLEIVYVNTDKATSGGSDVSRFKVARVEGQWVITSHKNYPADAENQIRDAATALIGVESIQIASDSDLDHEMYGVLQPDPEKASAGEEGVGKLITMKEAKGKELAALIVGKEVAGDEKRRFVRRPTQSRVYTAEINLDAFSTDFENWIEQDLLELNTQDVNQVVIRDYSVVPQGVNRRGQLVADFQRRFDLSLVYDDNEWKLERLLENRNNKMVPTELLDDEELNTSKLSAMKFALDDLKIVDVERKPKGLGPNLKASEEFLKDAAARQALTGRGFFVGPALEGEGLDLISSDGEVIIKTKDAVEYVLRFGEVAGMTGEGDDSQLNRYLFVTARLDDAALQSPDLEPLPQRPADKPADDATGQPEPPEAKPPAKVKEGDDADPDADPDPPAKTGTEGPQGEPGTEGESGATADPTDAVPTVEDAAESTEKPAAEETTDDADATEKEGGEAAPKDDADAAQTPDEGADPDTATPSETAEPDAADGDDESAADRIIDLDAEIARINRENQRKLDEHEEKKKKANKKLRELNARFGDWYFVISDDVYKKIHLSKSNVIKEKDSAKKEGSGVDAFRELQGGIEGGNG
jgi:hypothetical protein